MFRPFDDSYVRSTIHQLQGKATRIPVFEITQESATSIGGSVQVVPVDDELAISNSALLGDSAHSPLTINAWKFFHATAKTELSSSFSANRSRLHGVAKYCDLGELINWNQNPIRVRQSGVFARKDASRSYASSRFGEAISYLFMKSQGYIFWDHLPSLVERCILKSPATHAERTRKARAIKSRLDRAMQAKKHKSVLSSPDFVFETSTRNIALLESKGRMITPGKRPNFKADMAKALNQLSIWQTIVAGKPKAIAAGTYLREVGDGLDDSMFAFVDPPGDEADEDLKIDVLDDNMLRRGNYAAWMRGMGLIQSAQTLATGEKGNGTFYQLPVVKVQGREFVFSPWWWPSAATPRRILHSCLFEELMSFSRRQLAMKALLRLANSPPSFGLELKVMRRIEGAINASENNALDEIQSLEMNENQESGISVFPDGSIFADEAEIFLRDRAIGIQDFRL